MKTELHCHTTLSDGATGMEDLFRFAKLGGIDNLAITDHDTIDGYDQALVLAGKYGIRLIPGVEISTFDYSCNRRVHMLCYYYQDRELLNRFLHRIQENRRVTAQRMLEKVSHEIPISIPTVREYAKDSFCVFKQHIMRTLIDMGYTNEMYGPLFKQLFDAKTGSCYMTPTFPDVYETLEVIRQAGGLAVMAHPSEYRSMELLRELTAKHLLDGIELWHPRTLEEDKEEIAQLVSKYGLFATGGTDFHGMHSSRCHRLGTFTTPDDMFYRMEAQAQR